MTMNYRLNSYELIESSIMAAKRDGYIEGVSAEGLARWIQNVNRSYDAAQRGELRAREYRRKRDKRDT